MTRRQIPNAVPHLGGNEWTYLKECLDTNWVSSAGPFVDRFEREAAASMGARHGVATVTGTAALHVALLLAGVGTGDLVLVPALTFIATANAVRYCGADPVFLDSDPTTWCLDPGKTEAFLDKECEVHHGQVRERAGGRRVAAVVPVHLYGHPADADAFVDICRRWPLALVEDAAEALGARYKGEPLGVRGVASTLSFNGNKIVTAGGGGMVLTDDPTLAERARYLTTQGRDPGPEWIHREVAFNYRLTNLHAAVGLAQLEQLDAFVNAKRATARAYAEALATLGGVTPFRESSWARSTYWMTSALFDDDWGDVRKLVARANEAGIGLRPLWRPLHRQPAFAGCRADRIDVADRLYDRGASLPCSVGITPQERDAVVAALRELRS